MAENAVYTLLYGPDCPRHLIMTLISETIVTSHREEYILLNDKILSGSAENCRNGETSKMAENAVYTLLCGPYYPRHLIVTLLT